MRYGIPYKGSKNFIAKWIIDTLPPAKYFIDLFCGGGAVTHRALLTGKYQYFIMNDINPKMPQFFVDCIHGKYTKDTCKEWVSREDFQKKHNTDVYIQLCWSFGNNGTSYLYSKEIEPWERALWFARQNKNYEELRKFGVISDGSSKDIITHHEEYKTKYKQWYVNTILNGVEEPYALKMLNKIGRLERLGGLENLGRLEDLQKLNILPNTKALKIYARDYREVPLNKDAVIYCDIPYKGTNCGIYQKFDHNSFYEWARQQDNIFISEYTMPKDFIEINNIKKFSLSSSLGNSIKATEKIFTNEKTYYRLPKERKRMAMLNMAEQFTISDFTEE